MLACWQRQRQWRAGAWQAAGGSISLGVLPCAATRAPNTPACCLLLLLQAPFSSPGVPPLARLVATSPALLRELVAHFPRSLSNRVVQFLVWLARRAAPCVRAPASGVWQARL